MEKPLLAITMGDVNGIGPEILAQALLRPEPWAVCRPLVLGDATALRGLLSGKLEVCPVDSPAAAGAVNSGVPVMECGAHAPERSPGTLDPAAGAAAVRWIEQATRMAMAGEAAGLVTCPIHKACVHRAGFDIIGHTDFIADITNAPDYRMCLFTGTMRIVHITAHLSLRDALAEVKRQRIETSVRIGHAALTRMGMASPRIAVAGLNPHAGEEGKFGREEIEEIAPAVAACRAAGMDCTGPYPPDTLFGRMRAGEFDMVIAMYHDQGHIPLKLIAMDEGVNVTLGIPIVRTSVDHGTAYDIAGKGLAREDSLCAAIGLAVRLAGCGA